MGTRMFFMGFRGANIFAPLFINIERAKNLNVNSKRTHGSAGCLVYPLTQKSRVYIVMGHPKPKQAASPQLVSPST
eukprot:scaffold30360_cov150-Skeletonema_dohrnii-CCMP3373.AAC.5